MSRSALAILVAIAAPAFAADPPKPATSAAPATAAAPAVPAAPASKASLPPDEAGAKARLETSPRHGEWSDVKVATGGPVRTWVVYPERKDKAGVVIVISEIFGLSDWIRGVADQLAAEGFIAVAPDLLSGKGPNGGATDAFASRDDVVKGIRGLDEAEVLTRLNAVREWAVKLPSANGKSASIGFCWGGARSFAWAASGAPLDLALVYYGSSPDAAAIAKLKAPVEGHYGGDDARVNSTIDGAKAEVAKLGKSYEANLYDGAGHGFLRQQDGRDGANRKAAEAAWMKSIASLKKRI